MTRKRVSHLWHFTLVLLTILTVVAVPAFRRSLVRSKEFSLKNHLYTLRVTIDEYTFDKKKPPRRLDDLVKAGYLLAVPIDPMTGSDRTWRATIRTSDRSNAPGIFDVHSGSDAKSLDGVPYSEW
jgi:general secretion pathway protein G